MKFASFKYDTSVNLGDQVQSLAAEQHLPSVDEHLDRDSLHDVAGPREHVVIMNGWFSDFPQNWPPSEAVQPVFFGFHMTWRNGAKDRFLQADSVAYLKQHGPIGCRDRQTRDWLLEKGVDAFYSKCLTLTFPRRERAPKNGKVFLVDVDFYPIPKWLRRRGIKLSQMTMPIFDDATRREMAQQLLETYRDEASLVVTSKLHCAMPCLAMGVPVVFIGRPGDYRTSILEDMGLTILPYKLPQNKLWRLLKWALHEFLGLGYVRQNVWNPPAPDIEAQKGEIKAQLERTLEARLAQFAEGAAHNAAQPLRVPLQRRRERPGTPAVSVLAEVEPLPRS